MTQVAAGVVFVDLDGTLTLGNTFHALLRAAICHGSGVLRAQLFWAIVRRAVISKYGRVRMKQDILVAIAVSGARQVIVDSVKTHVMDHLSSPILAHLAGYRSRGWRVVLATAAPDLYAESISQEMGFDDCLCTRTFQPDALWVELSGVAKGAACQDWLAHSEMAKSPMVVAMTDSMDDLPLLALCQEVVLQGAPDLLGGIRAALGPGVAVHECDTQSSEPGGGTWLWYEDVPHGPLSDLELRNLLRAGRGRHLIYAEPGHWVRVSPRRLSRVRPLARVSSPMPPSLLQQWMHCFRRAPDWVRRRERA